MGPAIRLAIEKAHATLSYLPKYSPDLNPIELPLRQPKPGRTPAAWRELFRASLSNSLIHLYSS